MTPAAALAVLLHEVTDAARRNHVIDRGDDLDRVDLALVENVIRIAADVERWDIDEAAQALASFDSRMRFVQMSTRSPLRARLVTLLAKAEPVPPTPENMTRAAYPLAGQDLDTMAAATVFADGVAAERARVTRG